MLIIVNVISIDKTKDIYFIGSTHTPNIEAINYFLEHVWVNVIKLDSNIKFHIIGSCGYSIEKSYENVEIRGFMSDNELNNFLNSVRINIVPLLSGGGMKGKVLQSFNHGVPVISSDIGIQGMNVNDKSEVLMINLNDPIKCAKNIYNYYHDLKTLRDCSDKALKYFNSNFNEEKSKEYMNNMFKKIDSLPKKQNNKNNSCIVLCVVYSYIDSINIIYEFFKRKRDKCIIYILFYN